jgi:uroporphyrin-III C-methyltransferase
VSLTTAMTADSGLHAGARHADTEVFYMAGRQLGTLARKLRAGGWAADTPVCVVSRAGCADAVASEHRLDGLAAASVLHAGRPAVVTVGVGAQAVAAAPRPRAEAEAALASCTSVAA